MISLKLVTPYGIIYQDEVEKITISTTTGEITVLQNHMPLISVLAPGEMIIFKGDHAIPLAVSGGFFEIQKGSTVAIMADTAERAEHIDIDRAETARARAEELLKKQDALADVDFARLQAKIEKELARISVGKKYKNVRAS